MSLTPFLAKVSEVKHLSGDAISITFDLDGDLALSYLPGQYLTLISEINGQEVRRAYSLCSSPYNNDKPTVAVKLVRDGLMSQHLINNLKDGQELRLLPPIGHFTLEVMPLAKRHFVLIGAGSGITPLLSMLKSVLKAEPNSLVTLIYGNSNEDSILFRTELEAWQNAYPSKLHIVHCLSKPTTDWFGPKGRINTELLNEILDQTKPVLQVDETHYYLCGPQGLMDTAIEVLKDRKVKPYQIHKESFYQAVSEEAKKAGLAAAEAVVGDHQHLSRNVSILFDGEEFEVLVSPDETILEAALALDIPLPYSCQAGLCTACRAKCTGGKVHMDEMEGLSTAEEEQGYVLTCVAHPLTNDVVIDYN